MASIAHSNLKTYRAQASVWERRGWNGTADAADIVRWLLGAGGGALVVQGARERNVRGVLLAGVGISLAWWAFASEGDIFTMRHRVWALVDRWRGGDRVEDASADSFPASDAPAWTPTVGAGVHHGSEAR